MDNDKTRINKGLADRMKSFARIFPDGKRTNFNSMFERELSSLKREVTAYNPASLISLCSSKNLVATNFQMLSPEITRTPTLEQHLVEFLQSILLINNKSDYKNKVPSDDELTRVEQRLFKIGASTVMQFMSAGEDKHGRLGNLISSNQGHTMAVRNFSYPQHLARFIEELYEPLNSEIKAILGFEPKKLNFMFNSIVKKVERRFTDEYHFLARLKEQGSIFKLAEFIKANPEYWHLTSTLTDSRNSKNPMRDFFEGIDILTRSNLVQFFTFSPDEINDLYPDNIEIDLLKSLLDECSLQFGEYDQDPNHIFLNNLIWNKPFIKVGEEHFFLPIPALLYSFGSRIIWNLTVRDPNLRKKLLKRKGTYLENSLETQMRKRFKDSEVLAKVEWKDNEDNGENDVVIASAPYLILLEAKAGDFDPKGKRGAAESLKESIEKLILEPADQSSAFIAWLKRNPGVNIVKTKHGSKSIDTSKYSQFIRLSVTLEHLCPFTSNWQSLTSAGIASETLEPVPTFRLTDLWCVLEVLETQTELVHYWKHRQLIEKVISASDELGCLNTYLHNQLQNEQTSEIGVLLPLYAQLLDPYFLQSDNKIPVSKPESTVPTKIKTLIRRLEKSCSDDWLPVTVSILDLSKIEQKKVSDSLDRVQNGKGKNRFESTKYEVLQAPEICICFYDEASKEQTLLLAEKIAVDNGGLDVALIKLGSREEDECKLLKVSALPA